MVKKCLRISFSAQMPQGFLQNVVQKFARNCGVEGMAQILATEERARVIVCGDRESIEKFLDQLHAAVANFTPEAIEVEPFLKDKDYRGVFRVIE